MSLPILMAQSWAGCDDDRLIIKRETSFGLTIGGDNESEFGTSITMNIPLSIDGKKACYHQTSAIGVKTKTVKENDFVDYEITPIEASFENIPNAKIRQFLLVDYNKVKNASEIYIMSYLCSGETPIGGDVFSDGLAKIAMKGSATSLEVQTVFATGRAAELIKERAPKRNTKKIYQKFMDIYSLRTENKGIPYTSRANVSIPDFLATTSLDSISSIERKLYAEYSSRTGSELNGCSNAFLQTMQDHLIENIAVQNPFPGIEIKKKRFSTKYKLRWNL